MASLILFSEDPPPKYVDKRSKYTQEEMAAMEAASSTVYVGRIPNQKPYIATEAHIYSIFSQCGPIKKIIMGVFHEDNSPAGFCFVEYFHREDALAAIKWLDRSIILCQRVMVNIDYGFEEGRQYRRYTKEQQLKSRNIFKRRKFKQHHD